MSNDSRIQRKRKQTSRNESKQAKSKALGIPFINPNLFIYLFLSVNSFVYLFVYLSIYILLLRVILKRCYYIDWLNMTSSNF